MVTARRDVTEHQPTCDTTTPPPTGHPPRSPAPTQQCSTHANPVCRQPPTQPDTQSEPTTSGQRPQKHASPGQHAPHHVTVPHDATRTASDTPHQQPYCHRRSNNATRRHTRPARRGDPNTPPAGNRHTLRQTPSTRSPQPTTVRTGDATGGHATTYAATPIRHAPMNTS